MNCESRRLGEEFCPMDAAYWVFIDMPFAGGERALCGEHAGLELVRDHIKPRDRRVKYILPIGDPQ